MVVRDRRAKMRWPDGQMKRGGHCFARTTTPGLSLQSSMALRGPSDPDIPLEAIPPFPGSNPGAPASQGIERTALFGRAARSAFVIPKFILRFIPKFCSLDSLQRPCRQSQVKFARGAPSPLTAAYPLIACVPRKDTDNQWR